MKMAVLIGFIDKDTNIYHKPGEVVEYPEARAKEIEYKGYGKCLDKPKPSKVETRTTEESKGTRRTRVSEEPKREPRKR